MFCKKTKFNIVPITDIYRAAVDNQIAESFAGPFMVSRGMLHDTRTHAGFAAVDKSEVVGYILYNIIGAGCEITVIESLRSKQGIGGALTDAVKQAASESGCKRLWLITTNDNAAAFRFYQRYGFSLCNMHIDSMIAARKLKPQIPLYGIDGIPIAHELEFEISL